MKRVGLARDIAIAMNILSALRRPRRPRPFANGRYLSHYEGVLGTALELQITAADRDTARCAERAVLAEIDRLDGILSGYSSASELARWQGTTNVDVTVPSELAAVLADAEYWRHRTGGAFDPAVQSMIDRFRHGGGGSQSDVAKAPLDPLWRVDRGRGLARRLTYRAISLDGIAKGYIVRRAAACALEVIGVTDVIVNIGGDVQHYGPGTVNVGVADPFAPAENVAPIAVAFLSNEALATSGGYRRRVQVGDRSVSHIFDPRRGCPVEHVWSASVIAPDCATADTLSTAFCVLSPDESVTLANATAGVGCFLVHADRSTTASAGWNAHTKSAAAPAGERRHT